MAPRGFTNPAPKTESARSALSAFTCSLCSKSYSRQPEYEAHISSYDHQHRKRLQDLKQLSRDPNAAEKARKAEKKADVEAGLRVIGTGESAAGGGGGNAAGGGGGSGGGGGGFKKGGFKSSFTAVKASAAPVNAKKNVLGGDDEEDGGGARPAEKVDDGLKAKQTDAQIEAESDTDEEYSKSAPGKAYYDPRRPTDCFSGCRGATLVS